MPRKDKAIYVHADVFKALQEAKIHFEGLTRTRTTWSGFLYALAAGALAISAFGGLRMRCPLCGDFGMELYYKSFVEEQGEETSSEAFAHR